MSIHPDRVAISQRILDLWRAELAPRTRRWSVLVSAAEIDLAHDFERPFSGDGAAAALLTRQAIEIGLGGSELAAAIAHGARAARRTGGAEDLIALLALVGGPETANDRLRRSGLRSRFAADGSSRLFGTEQAETMAALTGNPAYAPVLPAFAANAPWGLAAYLVADAPFWHAQGTGPGVRHDGGVLTSPDGSELVVQVLTEVDAATSAQLDDPVLAAAGRALARTLRLLGHGELAVPV